MHNGSSERIIQVERAIQLSKNPEITVVINLHREGWLASYTIASVISAVEFAKLAGITSEIIIVLDSPDEITGAVAERYVHLARVQRVAFRSLSESRNYAVREARGGYIGFIDGDDLWGRNWLRSAFQELQYLDKSCHVIHPKMNIYFGRGFTPYCFVHPDMRYEKLDLLDLIVANRWTALSFAEKGIYQKFKFVHVDLEKGFSYEDWAWNYRTVEAGIKHVAVEDGLHFIRRKKFGSMLMESHMRAAIPLLYPRSCEATST